MQWPVELRPPIYCQKIACNNSIGENGQLTVQISNRFFVDFNQVQINIFSFEQYARQHAHARTNLKHHRLLLTGDRQRVHNFPGDALIFEEMLTQVFLWSYHLSKTTVI